MQKQDYKNLAFSIRKRGKDEIEIRLSTLDGYIRGVIRAILVGMLCVGSYFDTSHRMAPFSQEINSIKKDFTRAFYADEIVTPLYDKHIKFFTDPETIKLFGTKKIKSYEEYKAEYLDEHKWSRVRAYFHFIWIPFVIFLIFFPKMNGIRVNRKKRLIYWQSIGKNFEIAYVPEKGEPLSGLVYDKFGLYAFGGGKCFSLRFDILTQGEKEPAHHYAGVYPTPNENHNDHILLAIQSYLTEENPEFLQYIGNRFKVFSGSYPFITFLQLRRLALLLCQ